MQDPKPDIRAELRPVRNHRRRGVRTFVCMLPACLLIWFARTVSAEGAASLYVYRDAGSPENHGLWSNVVPAAGNEMLRIDLADRTGPGSGATAIRIDITFTSVGWCGIAVSSSTGYWGDRPGDGFDLRRARALSFRARGAFGGERIRVKAAVAGDQAFGDSAPLPIDSGWLRLSADWREYRIDTDGRDLSRVVTPFMLIANRKQRADG